MATHPDPKLSWCCLDPKNLWQIHDESSKTTKSVKREISRVITAKSRSNHGFTVLWFVDVFDPSMHIPTPPTLFPLSSFTFYNVPYICWLPPGTHPVKPSLLAALANLATRFMCQELQPPLQLVWAPNLVVVLKDWMLIGAMLTNWLT